MIDIIKNWAWLAPVISAIIAALTLLFMALSFVYAKLRSKIELRKINRSPKFTHLGIKSPIVIEDPVQFDSLHDRCPYSIRFGVMPYIDDTYVVIAERLGWFTELGLDVDFIPHTPETIVDALETGDIDIAGCVPSNIIERGKNQESIKAFAMGSIFQGYALMGRSKYRLFPFPRFVTYQEFRNKGIDHNSAIRKVAMQLKGKRITFSKDIAILPFLRHILSIGGLNLERDMVQVEVPENETVNMLLEGKVHLQIGGVPSRIVLERLGYQPIIPSSVVMSKNLMAKSLFLGKSNDYLAILQTGWFATEKTIINKPDLILRLASLNFRLIRLIKNNPGYAAQLQAPYLNHITKFQIDIEEIIRSFSEYHIFYDFKEQNSWFTKQTDPFYVPKVTMNVIDYWKQEMGGTSYINGPEDIIVAGDIYRSLLNLKSSCENLVKEFEAQFDNLSEVNQLVLRSANKHYKNYNFLDANLLLKSLKAK